MIDFVRIDELGDAIGRIANPLFAGAGIISDVEAQGALVEVENGQQARLLWGNDDVLYYAHWPRRPWTQSNDWPSPVARLDTLVRLCQTSAERIAEKNAEWAANLHYIFPGWPQPQRNQMFRELRELMVQRGIDVETFARLHNIDA